MKTESILHEIKRHAPYTLAGALTSVFLIALLGGIGRRPAFVIFYTLHPIHVLLSALVTSSLFIIHRRTNGRKVRIIPLILIGFGGSIGIATLSDSVIPYIGEILLGLPYREPHIGFIERWWLINPLAIAGIAWAFFKPITREPHAGHTLLSTYASLFHIFMAAGGGLSLRMYTLIFFFLLLAVWIPVMIGDIVLPLLFVRK